MLVGEPHLSPALSPPSDGAEREQRLAPLYRTGINRLSPTGVLEFGRCGSNALPNDVLHLGGIDALHVKEAEEQHAVLVHGLRAVGGETPVGRQSWRFGVEAIEAELGIGVADIEREKHGVLSLYLSYRVRQREGRRFAP